MPADVRALIREMSTMNPLWGAPRIHGELQKLGISVSQSTVAKYMQRPRRPPSQTWRTFLTNHASQIMAADFFVVPTVTFRLLFVLVILAHDRRQIVHVAVHRASDSGPDGTTTSHRVSVRRTLLCCGEVRGRRIPEGIVCGAQRGITRGFRGGRQAFCIVFVSIFR